ncbi:MAG: LAGLIDADG family homing endonuclease [Candidatus Diapherotrites archaeon]
MENRFHGGKHMITAECCRNDFRSENCSSTMDDELSIFDAKSDWLNDEIYVHGVKDEVKEIADRFGPVKLSRILKVDYNNCFREWTCGRNPIRLSKLIEMINLCDSETQIKLKEKIDTKELKIGCRYSPHKMRFPSHVSENLAYLAGLILGDGTLAGDSSNTRGNWNVGTLFDDENHQKIYDKLIENEFQITPNHQKDEKNCWLSIFGSKTTQWFWRSFFDMHNGYKASIITIPNVIANSSNGRLRVTLLQGLFDSDGTITKRGHVQYASTSKEMIEQVSKILFSFGIAHGKASWLKDPKYRMLHSIAIRRKSSVLSFAKQIGFRHPRKAAILAKFSLVV